LAGRLALPARHLEPVLQALVHAGVLNGTRGPQGGYQLDRLRITLADVVRAVGTIEAERAPPAGRGLVNVVIRPAVQQAEKTFATALGKIMIDDLVRQAERSNFVSKKR
jgi:DNA-binding IscR family transcriptional regulator